MRAQVGCLLLLCAPGFAAAQQDTTSLGQLQRRALETDPRGAQYELLERQSALRIDNLSAARLPQLSATGEATYQSEVPSIPVNLPGTTIPEPPQDRVEVALNADWLVWDGGATRLERSAERAALAAARARLAAELEPLRAEVNQAFFGALELQQRAAEATTLIEELSARLEEVRDGVHAGTALPGDTAAILAELLGVMERRDAVEAERAAALDVLERLTQRVVAPDLVLALPDLDALVDRVRASVGTADSSRLRQHPQFLAFAAERERLASRRDALDARLRPQSTLFGRLAYGWPGFEQFTDEPHDYWIGGVRVRWAPFDWGRTRREREALDAQAAIVRTQEAAFAERLLREAEAPLATIDRLRSSLATDERIVVLREQVARQARAQFDEHAITAAAYVDVVADLEQARVTRALHRVQLARAQATYLTLLGVPLP